MTICYISTHSSLDFNPSSEVATTQQTDSTAHKLKPRSFWQVCITELIAQSFYTLCIPKLTHRLLPPGVNCVWHVLWDAWDMNNFYFLFLLFSDFIGILFSFFLFFVDDEEARDIAVTWRVTWCDVIRPRMW